jgi:hypothetical protein
MGPVGSTTSWTVLRETALHLSKRPHWNMNTSTFIPFTHRMTTPSTQKPTMNLKIIWRSHKYVWENFDIRLPWLHASQILNQCSYWQPMEYITSKEFDDFRISICCLAQGGRKPGRDMFWAIMLQHSLLLPLPWSRRMICRRNDELEYYDKMCPSAEEVLNWNTMTRSVNCNLPLRNWSCCGTWTHKIVNGSNIDGTKTSTEPMTHTPTKAS